MRRSEFVQLALQQHYIGFHLSDLFDQLPMFAREPRIGGGVFTFNDEVEETVDTSFEDSLPGAKLAQGLTPDIHGLR